MGNMKFELNLPRGLRNLTEAVRTHLRECEACRHMVAAGKECLLAVRSVLDAKIRFLEELAREPGEQPQAESGEPRRIEVE